MKTTYVQDPELLRLAVNHIIEHPEEWEQKDWCGTACCIAGHIIQQSGQPEGGFVSFRAAHLVGLAMRGAVWLFWSGRTLFELYHFAYAMLHPEEYPNGRHRDGYDCYGVDSQGLDISGMPAYDELGDCINYARDDSGRDRFGFDLQGRDRTGKRLPLLEPVSDTCEMVYLKKEQ